MKIKTSVLQDMASKVGKCYSNNNAYPITSYLYLQLEGGKLSLVTTDMTNYFYANADVEDTDKAFYASVMADLFIKLVSSTTSDYVELNLVENDSSRYLEYVGNGKYKFEVKLDPGTGEVVRFKPCPQVNTQIGKVSLQTVRDILNLVKPALATRIEMPCYTNYFIGDVALATDSEVVNSLSVKLLDSDEPIFISSPLMDLVGLMDGDEVTVYKDGQDVLFVSNNCEIYSTLYSYANQFKIDDIMSVTKWEFPSVCGVRRSELLQILDRLALFLGDDENRAITLDFTEDGIQITTSAMSVGAESIVYDYNNDFKPFTGTISLDKLKSQIKAQSDDVINISYGMERAIKLTSESFLSIICLIQR